MHYESLAAYPVVTSEDKKEVVNEAGTRWAETFGAVLEKTLVDYYTAPLAEDGVRTVVKKDARNLPEDAQFSNYEKKLYQNDEAPKINMLIDIDGVLLDTEDKIKKLVQTVIEMATGKTDIGELKKEAAKSKIPFGVLRTLLQCRNVAEELWLVTDRFGVGPCYFPCFSRKGKAVFEKHDINVNAGTFKPLASGEKFLPLVRRSDITYYVGSSGSDKNYATKIRKNMKAQAVPDEKLVYLQVGKVGQRSIL